MLDRLTRLEILLACRDTVDRYAQAVNDRDHDAFVRCFAEDGVWIRPGMEMHGRKEMHAFMSRPDMPRHLRHVNGQHVVDVIDEQNAKGISYTTVYHSIDDKPGETMVMRGPDYVVEYRDDYRPAGDRWLIMRRKTRVVFQIAQSYPLPGIPRVKAE